MSDFKIGETWRPEDATEEEARAILGNAVYESWRESQLNPDGPGTVTITSIDSTAGVITFDTLPSGADASAALDAIETGGRR